MGTKVNMICSKPTQSKLMPVTGVKLFMLITDFILDEYSEICLETIQTELVLKGHLYAKTTYYIKSGFSRQFSL